jgi:hypothetical protein
MDVEKSSWMLKLMDDAAMVGLRRTCYNLERIFLNHDLISHSSAMNLLED